MHKDDLKKCLRKYLYPGIQEAGGTSKLKMVCTVLALGVGAPLIMLTTL